MAEIKQKLGVVTPVSAPHKSGMARVAEMEGEMARTEWLVEIFSPTTLGAWFKFGNGAWCPALLWNLRKCEAVHLHYPFFGGAGFVWVWSVLYGRPYAVTFHMRAKAGGWRGAIFLLQQLVMEPLILKRATVILVASIDYARSVGVQGDKVRALPFGVDLERFSPSDKLQARSEVGIAANENVVLFVGGLDRAHAFKGIENLLRAVRGVPDCKLVVVGDGDFKERYQQLAREIGISDKVIWAGAVSDQELPTYYRSANLHCLPSVAQNEAYGLVTLEAAASGVASLVSNLPGMRELVLAGETGWLVEPTDVNALTALIALAFEDPIKLAEMGKAARRWSTKFSLIAEEERLLAALNLLR